MHLQLEAVGLHLRTGGDIADSATAHDTESRLPGDILHAAAFVARASDFGGARLVSQFDQISGHLPVGQQRLAAEAGEWAQGPKPILASVQSITTRSNICSALC